MSLTKNIFMPHQDSLVDFCFSEPAGLLRGKKHFHGYLFTTPLSHPDFSIATFSNLLYHLNLFCDGPLNLWNAKMRGLQLAPQTPSAFTSLLLCLLPTQQARWKGEYTTTATWISAKLHKADAPHFPQDAVWVRPFLPLWRCLSIHSQNAPWPLKKVNQSVWRKHLTTNLEIFIVLWEVAILWKFFCYFWKSFDRKNCWPPQRKSNSKRVGNTFLIKTGMFVTYSTPLRLKVRAHMSQKHIIALKLAELLRAASYHLPWKSQA